VSAAEREKEIFKGRCLMWQLSNRPPWKHIKHPHRADDQRTSRYGSRCRPQTIHCRSPVQTRPCGAPRRRQGHVHHLRLSAKQCPTPGTANAIILSVKCQQLLQLGDIGRNGPRSGAGIIFSRVNRTGQNRSACTPCRPSTKSTITTPRSLFQAFLLRTQRVKWISCGLSSDR
jgi:hypothetical protein